MFRHSLVVLIVWYNFNHTIASFHLEDEDHEKQQVTECLMQVLPPFSIDKYIALVDGDGILDFPALHAREGSRFILHTHAWTESAYTNIYVITVGNYPQLVIGMNSTRNHYFWNPTAYFLIYLEHIEDRIKSLSRVLLDYNILNVAVVTKNRHDYDIYSYRRNFNACNKSEVLVVVNQCSKIKGKLSPPKRTRNLRGCHFKLVAYDRRSVLINFGKPEGIENYAFRLFEEHTGVKFNVTVYDHDNKPTFPRVPVGLKNKSVEVSIGGYILSKRYASQYSYTYPVMVDRLMVMLRRPEFLNAWEALFFMNILPIAVTLFTLIVFCCLSVHLSLFSKRETDTVRDVFIVVGYFFNKVSVKNIKPDTGRRLLVASLLFFVFIVPYIYQTYLFSIITHPLRGYEEKDLQQIYKSFIAVLPHNFPFRHNARSCRNNSTIECLIEVRDNKHGNLYTLISYEQEIAYGTQLKDEECNLRLCTQRDSPLSTLLRTFYFQRGSILTKPFSDFFIRLRESGLIRKASNDYKNNENMKCKPVLRRNSYSLWDVKEAFFVLVFGYTVSIITFLIECILHSTRAKKI